MKRDAFPLEGNGHCGRQGSLGGPEPERVCNRKDVLTGLP